MGPNEILKQLLTAPFPQMLLTSIATLIISYVLLNLTKIRSPKIRGFFYSLTLVAPIIVYIFFTPSIWVMRPVIQRGIFDESKIIISQARPAVGETVNGFIMASPVSASLSMIEEIAGVNYTGLLCIIGLTFGAITLAISYLFGVRIVKRCQGVIDITAEDEPKIFKSVERLAQRVGVPKPKIGLTENLQPNAFTIGYGRGAVVVFSSGLIAALNQLELEAVIAHELAHIKNRDFYLMAIVSSLKVVSFFNPAAYLSASMLSREREYLADEVGSKATGRKNTLKKALIKIASIPTPRRRTIIPELVSGFFIYSQIGSLKAAFTSHPSLDTRLDRISRGKFGSEMDPYKAALVAIVLVGSMVALSYYIMQPMRLFEIIFKYGPGVKMPLGETFLIGDVWVPRPNTFSFSLRSFGEAVTWKHPNVVAMQQLVVR